MTLQRFCKKLDKEVLVSYFRSGNEQFGSLLQTYCVVNCHVCGTCYIAVALQRPPVCKVCLFCNYICFFLQEYSTEMCLQVHTECSLYGLTHKSQRTFRLCFVSRVTSQLTSCSVYGYELWICSYHLEQRSASECSSHQTEKTLKQILFMQIKDKNGFVPFKSSFLLKFTYERSDRQWLEWISSSKIY